MNIYEKVAAITNEIGPVAKNLTVWTGKSTYKAVAEADILNVVKTAEAKYKVLSYPSDHKIIESREIVKEYKEGTKSTTQFIRMETTYRFVNLENPEEYLEVRSYGDGCDSLDKAPGKAMTYADKYALMKAYKIETGEDTDQHPSDELEGHNIMAIKQRVERTLTAKLNAGMDMADVLSRAGLNQREFEKCMKLFDTVDVFEKKIIKA